MKRKRYSKNMITSSDGYGSYSYHPECTTGGLLSSEIHGDRRHLPVFDIDDPSVVMSSKTDGHYHLLAPMPIKWRKYRKMIKLMVECGMVDPSWAKEAIGASRGLVFQPIKSGQET